MVENWVNKITPIKLFE